MRRAAEANDGPLDRSEIPDLQRPFDVCALLGSERALGADELAVERPDLSDFRRRLANFFAEGFFAFDVAFAVVVAVVLLWKNPPTGVKKFERLISRRRRQVL